MSSANASPGLPMAYLSYPSSTWESRATMPCASSCRIQVRRQHRDASLVTPYHLKAAEAHLGLAEGDLRACVRALGGTVWEEAVGDDEVGRS